jgi:hypothetical protein
MRTLVRLAGAVSILAVPGLTACGDGRFMRVGLDPLSSLGIPAFQQVDDSIHLYATEWRHSLLGSAEPAIPSSDIAPEHYTWSSSNSAIAEMRASGWMIARESGNVVITVRGGGSVYSQTVAVCSRGTELRIDPRDPVIRLHDTMTVSVSLATPGGVECGRLDFGPFMPQQGSGTAGLEPIFSLPNHWRAIRAGTFWYTSSILFAGRTLRDSILVTVQ